LNATLSADSICGIREIRGYASRGGCMNRMILAAAIAVLMSVLITQAALRQTTPVDPRVHLTVGIPPDRQATLRLPDSKTIELSALDMQRDEQSVMYLKGDVEIKFALSPGRVAVIRTDEATYNVNTAQLEIPAGFQMSEEMAAVPR
jgi:hypothetical protein